VTLLVRLESPSTYYMNTCLYTCHIIKTAEPRNYQVYVSCIYTYAPLNSLPRLYSPEQGSCSARSSLIIFIVVMRAETQLKYHWRYYYIIYHVYRCVVVGGIKSMICHQNRVFSEVMYYR